MSLSRLRVYSAVANNPGLTGMGIRGVLLGQTWLGRWLGARNFLTEVFGSPGVSATYSRLADLERADLVRSEFVPGPYPRRRVYFANPIGDPLE